MLLHGAVYSVRSLPSLPYNDGAWGEGGKQGPLKLVKLL